MDQLDLRYYSEFRFLNIFRSADNLYEQGRESYLNGDFKLSLEYFLQALVNYQSLCPKPNHINIAKTLNFIGCAYHDLGDFQKALEYREKTLEMKRTLFGENDLRHIADALNNIGITYGALKDFQKSLEYFRQTLEIQKRMFGNIDHRDIRRTLNNIGITENHLGNREKFVEFSIQATEMQKRLEKSKNSNSTEVDIEGSPTPKIGFPEFFGSRLRFNRE